MGGISIIDFILDTLVGVLVSCFEWLVDFFEAYGVEFIPLVIGVSVVFAVYKLILSPYLSAGSSDSANKSRKRRIK